MDEFEKLLESERASIERFVKFRLNSKSDADDVLQEVFLAAFQKIPQLKNKDFFKAWKKENTHRRVRKISGEIIKYLPNTR